MVDVIKASAHHCGTISRMIRESFREQAGLLGLGEEEHPHYAGFETPRRVCARMGRGDTVLLALLGDIPVGTVSCGMDPGRSGRGFISRLCVLPRYRGKGLGELLLKRAEELLAASGSVSVQISIAAEFVRLQIYYQGLGYLPGEKKTVPSLPFQVLYMEKRL